MEPSRPQRFRRARLVVNRLEEREVPAGIVTVSSTGGHFVLTGDDLDNVVSVSMTTGASADVTITPDAATTIDDLSVQGLGTMGQPVTFKVQIQDFHFVAKGGNDAFSVTDPNGLQMPGAFALDMGDGNNFVDIETNGKFSAGDFSITGGDGFDRCIISPRDPQSGMATGRRSHKPMTFSLGDGGFDVSVSSFTVAGAGVSFTAGDSPLVGQGGGVGGSFVADNFSMDGGFSSNTGGGLCSFSFGAVQMGSYGHGSGGGGGRVSVSFVNNSHVKGEVSVSAPGGVSIFADHTIFDKSVKVQKKWLPANFRTSADLLLQDSPVAGGVSVSAFGGSTTDSVDLIRSPVTGPVSVSNSGPNGAATLDVTDSSSGPVSVQATGQGGVASASYTGGNFALECKVMGTNSAGLFLTGSLFLGASGAQQPTGNVTISSKAGSAMCSVSGGGGGAGGALRAVDLSVSGFKDAEVDSDTQATIRLAGNWNIKSQQFASIGDTGQDGIVNVDGAVSVSGVDMAALQCGDSWTSGPVTVTSRKGPTITNFTPTTLQVTGDFTSAGGDSCIVTVAPKSPGALDGSVNIKGGAGDDTIVIQDVDGLQDVLVDMGNGSDSFTMKKTFVLPHVLEVSGNVSVTQGSGAGKVSFQDLHFTKRYSAKMGGGADVVSIDSCTFEGPAGFDCGAGDDDLRIAKSIDAASPTFFKGPVSIVCGDGNDTFTLGLADDPLITEDDNSRVVFAQGVQNKIDGGGGLNSFDPQACHFDNLDAKGLLHFTDPTP
jgi:hypothetical protein